MNILVAMPTGFAKDTFFPPDIVKSLESLGQVTWNESEQQFTADELKEKINEMDVCITGWGCPRFDENVLGTSQRLRLVAHTGGSVASIVSSYLYEKGIKVLSGNRIFAESVAEGVIAYALCSLRELPYYSNELQKGRWTQEPFHNEGLLDQTMGLVGFGMVARYLVNMLLPFRVKIKVYDPYVSDEVFVEYGVERSTLEDIFSTSKIISIHASSTPDTWHMIDRRLLNMITDGAILINTSRGGLINEQALAEELQKKRFQAVLDVFEVEPLPADSPLMSLPNAILLPHMAGPTIDRRKFVTSSLIEDIENFFSGRELKNEINRNYAMSMTR